MEREKKGGVPSARDWSRTPGPSSEPTVSAKPLETLFEYHDGELVAENLNYAGVRHDGGMSVVLKVIHGVDHRPRACKILRPELADRSDAVEGMIQEFRRAKKVTGDHAVALYDLGKVSGLRGDQLIELPYFTMEWVEGGSLGELLSRNPHGLDAQSAFGLALQLAKGLASLHAVDVLHLDLKPSNIMLDPEEVLKIIDFGVGLDLRRRHDEQTAGRWLTSSYAPWELLEGRFERVCPATDVFQAAVILHELFTGAPTKNVSYAALSDRIEYVPVELDELILKCLAEDPETRFSNGAELLDSLTVAFGAFKANRRAGRRLPSAKPRELWEKLKLVARGKTRIWEYQAALARDLLDELEKSGGSGGFLRLGGKIDVDEVQRLLGEAESELRSRRVQRFRRYLDRADWDGARDMLSDLEGEVAQEELSGYAELLEIEESVARGRGRTEWLEAHRRACDFLKEEKTPSWIRQEMAGLLQRITAEFPQRVEPAPRDGASFLDEPGPPSLWTCAVADAAGSGVVVPGSVLHLGRGSWREEGAENHVDLRPTVAEAEREARLADLCLQLSHRALEIQIVGQRVEALCTGRFGAVVDGQSLAQGQAVELAEAGEIALALRASVWSYTAVQATAGHLSAFEIEGQEGVGAGRNVWLIPGPLDLHRIFPILPEDLATIVPTVGSWRVEARKPGLSLNGRSLQPGRAEPWPEGARLTGPGELSVIWAGAEAAAARSPGWPRSGEEVET